MNSQQLIPTNGYYHVRIFTNQRRRFFNTNNERAFVLLQLQQLLAARSVLEDPQSLQRLAHHIDLLAFSISETGIQLLLYTVARDSLEQLVAIICDRLLQYRSEYTHSFSRVVEPLSSIQKLAGEHEALYVSVTLHQLHKDWEYDRYSSVGFYLHDRRGDWMRLWRLSRLYENNPELYRNLIIESVESRSKSNPYKYAY